MLTGAGTASVDGPRIEERLRLGGADAAVTVVGPDTLRLTVARGRGPDMLPEVIARNVLTIGPVGTGLTNVHLADARAEVDPHSEQSQVLLTLTSEGADRFCALTGASVGQPIEIVLDGEVKSAPVVQEAICGGSLVITIGVGADPRREAEALANALTLPPLDGSWTLAEIR